MKFHTLYERMFKQFAVAHVLFLSPSGYKHGYITLYLNQSFSGLNRSPHFLYTRSKHGGFNVAEQDAGVFFAVTITMS